MAEFAKEVSSNDNLTKLNSQTTDDSVQNTDDSVQNTDDSVINTIVRVKRKRTQNAVPPEFLVFPKPEDKRAKLTEKLDALGFGDESSKGENGMSTAHASLPSSLKVGSTIFDSGDTEEAAGVVCAFVDSVPASLWNDQSKHEELVSKLKGRVQNHFKRTSFKKRVGERSANEAAERAKSARKNAMTKLRSQELEFTVVNVNLESNENYKKSRTNHDKIQVMDQQLDFALWDAYHNSNFEAILELVRQGHNVNFQRPSDGLTALMTACRHGNELVIDQLLAHGARMELVDAFGNSIYDHIEQSTTLSASQAHATKIKLNRYMLAPKESGTSGSQSGETTDQDDGEYVYDYYYVQRPWNKQEQSNVNVSPDKTLVLDTNLSLVREEAEFLFNSVGMEYFGDEMELVHDTRSQGLDYNEEEPDSNSERFEGNSYPDEDEFDDGYSTDSSGNPNRMQGMYGNDFDGCALDHPDANDYLDVSDDDAVEYE